mgnify:CR=1 FL=1
MGCQTDKDVREPNPIHSTASSNTDTLPSEKNRNLSPPNSATLLSGKKLKKIDSNSRQNTVCDDYPVSALSLSRLKTECQLNSNHQDSAAVLYSIDLIANKLVSFNVETQTWSSNNLSRAALHSSNPLFIPLKPLQEEVIDYLEDATALFISDHIVHFVGEKHFALDTKQNMFSYKQNRDTQIKNPTLCRIGDYIYALSGIEGDEYTTKCERYSLQHNTWMPIAPLHRPYYRGSACGFIDSDGHRKLIMVGGLSSPTARKSNQMISVYDIASDKWVESPIRFPLYTDPDAPSYPLFPYDDSNLSIISPNEDKIQQSLLNLTTGKLTNTRELSTKEKLTDITVESFCVHKGNLSLVLSEPAMTKDNKPSTEKSKNCVMISVKV